MINLSQQTVTAWENSKDEPTSGSVTHLAEIFNISADYLLGVKSDTASADKYAYLIDEYKAKADDMIEESITSLMSQL